MDMTEPIAIIGLDLKFPGDGSSPEDFFEMLQAGRSALSDIPKDRYNLEAFYHPDQERAGSINVRQAHFIRDNIAAFDAPFFSITAAEASCMDPQQRGLLECVYRALENAGIPMAKALGSNTSVHIGCFTREYDGVLSRDPEVDLKYISTGTGTAMLSNRLSWFFDFHGPSLTMDTACSSSLLAAHLGCTSLKIGEASMAIVGGANLFYNPDTVIPLTSLGFLSPDSKCHSFDHKANGYSRGEGFGIMVLKRVSDAIRDGDTIRAVIRNTASNQDGKSPGITQPTKEAQAELIREAYERVGLSPSSTRYFEAHGTGTPVGDPIEASAISSVFTKYRSPESPLYVGALKSNIGHLEGAAGIAGLMKSVFVLERGIIPSNLWFEKPNPKIPAEEWNLKFPTEATVWPDRGPRRASINAFGFGGSNAHAIIDDALHYLVENNLKGKHRTIEFPKVDPEWFNKSAVPAVSLDSTFNGTQNGQILTASEAVPIDEQLQNPHNPAIVDGYKIDNGGEEPNDIHIQHETNKATGSNTFHNTNGANGINGINGINSINGTNGTNGINVVNGVNGFHQTSGTHDLNGDQADAASKPNGIYEKTVSIGTDGENGTTSSRGSLEQALRHRVFVLSSFDESGIQRLAKTYYDYFVAKGSKVEDEDTYLDDLSYTLACRRSRFAWRSSVVANSLQSLTEVLEKGPKSVRMGVNPKLAFIFTGQGAQWPAMGRELLKYPVFRQSFDAAGEYLTELGCSWSLIDEFLKDDKSSLINDPAFSQPICTILQVALIELLASWSIYPKAVVGHSSGEIAAAFAASAISRESAWKIAYYRGLLSSKLAHATNQTRGGMLSVALGSEQALSYLEKVDQLSMEGSLAVACVNSPKNVTISGSIKKIEALKEILDGEDIFARKLQVDNAYHSIYMEVVATEYLHLISVINSGPFLQTPEEINLYSSSTGMLASREELRKGQYWVNNFTSPVRFSEAVTRIAADSIPKTKKLGAKQAATHITELLEIGPHAALRGPIREILEQVPDSGNVAYDSLLKRGESAIHTTLAAIGWLFCRGYNVDIPSVNLGNADVVSADLLVDLPSYPFNHSKSYWNESRLSKGYRFRKFPRHELLGAPVPDWNKNNAIWRNWIRIGENPWIRDHRVTGTILYPAAGMLVMAIEASRQLSDPDRKLKGFRFREVALHMALRIPLSIEGVETHFYLRPYQDSTSSAASTWSEFQLYSYEGEEWKEHCRGLIQIEYDTPYTPVDDGLEDRQFAEMCAQEVGDAESLCRKDVSTKQLYELLQTVGLDFGPTFQNLSQVSIGLDRNAVATIKAPDIKSKMPHGYVQPHVIHPTTLDGILQSILVALTRGGRDVREVMVPTSVKELWISADPEAVHETHRLSAKAKFLGLRQAEASFTAIDPVSRKPLVVADGFISTAVSSNSNQDAEAYRHLCFNIDWKPDVDFVDQEAATRLFEAPQELLEFDPTKLVSDMEKLCYMYLKRYMNSNPLDRVGKMKPHHQKYVAWIQQQINRHDRGELIHAKSDWNKLAEDETYFAELETQMENASPEATCTVTIGRVLPKILDGEIDPLEILFNSNMAENIYRRGTGAEVSYARLVGYINVLAHKNPDMKILEIGAGTGGATSPIMETLIQHGEGESGAARFSSYDFTDISPSFFEKAKDAFQDSADRMNFRVLNIEMDPIQQGFEAGQFDLVIAANVLHATKSIDSTLQNARKLLKPGGKLVLYELTNTTMVRTGFAFGLLPGWWLSAEPYREWGPLLSVPSWSSHLQRTGYTGVDIFFNDYADEYNQVNSVIISSASVEIPKTREIPPTVIVVDEASSLQKDIAGRIQRALMDSSPSKCQIAPLHELEQIKFDQMTCIFLPELESSFLSNLEEANFESLKKMTLSVSAILWLTQGGGPSCTNPNASLVTGFGRSMRAENPTLKFVELSVESISSASVTSENVLKIFNSIVIKGDKLLDDNSFFESNGVIHVSRIIEANYMNSAISTKTTSSKALLRPFGADPNRALKLVIASPGLLDTLQFDDDPLYEELLGEGHVEFRVMATALNFLDIMVALGQVVGNQLGVEGAGVVTRTGPNAKFKVGDRVCGIVRGTLKTYARGSLHNLTKVPDNLSWVSAASLPVVFVTAYCALYDIAHIKKGETVLIHAAAGGVGQACIQLAQLVGAEVYATVGSVDKRNLLEETYGIPRDHILSSRDLTFAQGIKRMTKGRGVDVVVNALSGAGLRATWDCIAPFGRFVEVGKVDIYSSARLNMEKFKNNVSFEFIDVGFMADNDGPRFERILEEVMQMVRDGKIKELNPVQEYPIGKLQDAFRYMQTGAHSGKIVLVPNDEDEVMTIPSRKPLYNFDSNATYVISGGLGGLGRSMAQWMAKRGAKNLILLSRSGATRQSGKDLVEELEAAQVNVATPPCDVSDAKSLKTVIEQCMTYMPPIKGLIQGSMVLKDVIFENMTVEDYYVAVNPKVRASWNLHEILPKDLDFFILLSSGSGVIGNRGQANYCVGNTYQDGLARYRVSQGLKATALDLGMILSVGFFAEKADVMGHLRQIGFAAMREEEYHAMLDELCNPNLLPSSHLKSQISMGFEIPETLRAKGIEEPGWMHDPMFRHLFQIRTVGSNADTSEDSINYGMLLAAAESHDAAVDIINHAIVRKLCKAMTIEEQDIDPSKPLHAHGVDSLVAVELRTWFLKEMGADVAVFDMMSGSSIRALAALVATRSSLVRSREEGDVETKE